MSVDRSTHWIARNNPMGGYGRRQSSSAGGDAMVTHVDVALVVGCRSSAVKKEGEAIFSKSLFCGSRSVRTSDNLANFPCRLDSFIQS